MTTPPILTNDVTDRVLNALQNDSRTRDEVIDASFHQGAVTLSGTVRSQAMREAADEIARQQQGVVTVINDLRVR